MADQSFRERLREEMDFPPAEVVAESLAREMYPEKFVIENLPGGHGDHFYKARNTPSHAFKIPYGSSIEGDPTECVERARTGGLKMISPENFDAANEEAQRAAATTYFPPPRDFTTDPIQDGELRESHGGLVLDRTHDISPISRLFAAVRSLLKGASVFDITTQIDTEHHDELKAAYEALGLKDE